MRLPFLQPRARQIRHASCDGHRLARRGGAAVTNPDAVGETREGRRLRHRHHVRCSRTYGHRTQDAADVRALAHLADRRFDNRHDSPVAGPAHIGCVRPRHAVAQETLRACTWNGRSRCRSHVGRHGSARALAAYGQRDDIPVRLLHGPLYGVVQETRDEIPHHHGPAVGILPRGCHDAAVGCTRYRHHRLRSNGRKDNLRRAVRLARADIRAQPAAELLTEVCCADRIEHLYLHPARTCDNPVGGDGARPPALGYGCICRRDIHRRGTCHTLLQHAARAETGGAPRPGIQIAARDK